MRIKNITFEFENSLVSQQELSRILCRLIPLIRKIKQSLRKRYASEFASLYLPSDSFLLKEIKKISAAYKKLDSLIIVGIGGSNLGTMAVQEALLGKYHNLTSAPQIFYSDTVDSFAMKGLLDIINKKLKARRRILINCISKSGRTTETIANFEVLLKAIKQTRASSRKNVVITTDRDSPLWSLSKKHGFQLLEIPKKVGGRYSVLSAVGLFPLAVMGIDIEQLQAGAKLMRGKGMNLELLKNPPAIDAALSYYHYQHNKNISEFFLFSTQLESVGKWYRQLLAESTGKEWDRAHTKQTYTGITPSVSIGSTDLHSMAQLYFGGPADKFTTIVTIENTPVINLPTLEEFESLVPYIQGKSFSDIMQAIIKGTKLAFRKQKRPFIQISLKSLDEFSLGQLLQHEMLKVIYLCYLLDVNPFDQPNVESYKIETKKVLGSLGKINQKSNIRKV